MHLPPELLPKDYVLTAIDLADRPIETIPTMPDDPQAFGGAWLAVRRTPMLQVPSAIVPESANLLINPAHAMAARARIAGTRPFAFDRRLWLPL